MVYYADLEQKMRTVFQRFEKNTKKYNFLIEILSKVVYNNIVVQPGQ